MEKAELEQLRIDPAYRVISKILALDGNGNIISPLSLQHIDEYREQEQKLKLAQCGWYYPQLDKDSVIAALKNQPEGCFLLRKSSHSKYKYTLSISTGSKVLNIRISPGSSKQYGFQLDCFENVSSKLPHNHCVISLIEDLIRTGDLSRCSFIDHLGLKNNLVRITYPVKRNPSSLKHLARLSLNSYLSNSQTMHFPQIRQDFSSLPNELKDYLQSYPNAI